jgi:hypothetical protein
MPSGTGRGKFAMRQTTPLAKRYARLVEQRIVVPFDEQDYYEFPTVLHEVPTITTSGVGILSNQGDAHAKLGTDTGRNSGQRTTP